MTRYSSAAFLGLAMILGAPAAVVAQSQAAPPAAAPAQVVHLDGVDVEYDANDQWTRIYATYNQPVAFKDRRGIKNAQIIAEEKAKAKLVRYFEEKVSNGIMIEELNTTIAKAKSSKGGTEQTAERKMVESIREFTRSYSSGTLRGVTAIEAGFNEPTEEAWVKVGLTRLSVSTAGKVGSAMQGNGGGSGQGDNQTVKPQGSEVRTRVIK